MNENSLSGTISKEISGLNQVKDLWLGDNMFSGQIPINIGILVNLGKKTCALDDNFTVVDTCLI